MNTSKDELFIFRWARMEFLYSRLNTAPPLPEHSPQAPPLPEPQARSPSEHRRCTSPPCACAWSAAGSFCDRYPGAREPVDGRGRGRVNNNTNRLQDLRRHYGQTLSLWRENKPRCVKADTASWRKVKPTVEKPPI